MKKILIICAFISVLIPLKNYAQEDLPPGWHATDIGSQAVPGSTMYDFETQIFTIESTGDQVFRPDNLHFAYTLQTGNFEVITMVSYLYGMGQMALDQDLDYGLEVLEEAGVMVREDLSPFSNAYYTTIVGGARGGVRNYLRNNEDLEKNNVTGSKSMEVPCWLKLKRVGNIFNSYYSADGINWTICPGASEKILMNSTCYAGIFVRGNANFVQINGWENPDPYPILPAVAEFEVTRIEEIANVYTVQNPVSPVFINLNSGGDTLDVSTVFGRLDEDVISYAANSSNTVSCKVMAVSVNQSLEFTPMTVGSTTISLTGNVNSLSLINKFPVYVWEAPDGWLSNDLGNPKTKGYVIKERDLFSLGGSASDSANVLSEGFHFMYRNLHEDSEISTRILTGGLLTSAALGGILFSTDPYNMNAAMARLVYCGDGFLRFESGTGNNDAHVIISESEVTLPVWIKLKNEGNVLKAYYSGDGSNWNKLGTDLSLDLNNDFTSGLIAGSADDYKYSQFKFDNFTLISSSHSVNNPVAGQRITEGQTKNITVTNVFGHIAGNLPLLSVVSSNPGILTASIVQDTILILTAFTAGNSVLTLSTGSGTEKLNNIIDVEITKAPESDWKFVEIGNLLAEGFSSKLGENAYSISTFGNQIQGTSDNFSFLYKEKQGSLQLTAKVEAIEDRGAGSQAGIMFRESILTGSLYIMYSLTSYEGVKLQYRWDDNSQTVIETSSPPLRPPCWLRLSRNENNYFTASYSIDSINWISHAAFSIPLELPETALVGLIAASGFNEGIALFDDVWFSIPTGTDNNLKTSLFSVKQYPNPFRETASIFIEVNEETKIELDVFDISGRKVAELLNANVSPGSFTINFNTAHLKSGVYFYRLITPGETITNKMLKIK